MAVLDNTLQALFDMSHKELLWENANTNSNFAPQTIKKTTNPKSLYLINCIYAAKYTATNGEIIPYGGNSYIVNSGTVNAYRNAAVTSAGFVFGAGYVATIFGGSSATLDNSRIIPYQIYEIKGVINE
ncbi:MAG: hypothetical protein ACLULK_06080 [Anaerovoracaceae bacterium]|jgi:hypothetical protein|uniref:Uncharacterized protein n=1 Tax=virus sp. ctyMK1 TaxID=2828002 RepID=A0A8S5RF41_9VIRU|nr:MAG TPA: hypothetical protein [virus sp. ctyMK1]